MAKKRRTNKVDQNKKALLEALEASLGVISTAVKKVGLSRSCYYKYVEADPEFQAAVLEIEQGAIDFVESQLFKQIKEGNTTATIFYLKTKGKNRGYIERQEITGIEGTKLFDIEVVRTINNEDEDTD